jgi:hypothetical protein
LALAGALGHRTDIHRNPVRHSPIMIALQS